MASFDASEAQTEQVGRVASLENTMGGVMAELHRLQSLVAQQAQHAQNAHYNQNDGLQYVPPPAARPNLNLPEPPRFSGTPSELPSFQLKLCQFLRGNYNTYFDTKSQLMYAGSLLTGDADQWYMTLVNPTTRDLPPHYTLDTFLQAMTDFFGGGHHPRFTRTLLGHPASNRDGSAISNCFSKHNKHLYPPVDRPLPDLCLVKKN